MENCSFATWPKMGKSTTTLVASLIAVGVADYFDLHMLKWYAGVLCAAAIIIQIGILCNCKYLKNR